MIGEDEQGLPFGSQDPAQNVEPVWDEAAVPVAAVPAATDLSDTTRDPGAEQPAEAATMAPAASADGPGGTGGGGGGGDDDPSDDPPLDPVFSQQLWEVQLLLNYLSGDAARRLPDKAAARAAGLDEDWIEQVCRISWPPSGSRSVRAMQEALLIRVADYLNWLAAPANGASIAFTRLVAQDEGEGDAPDGDPAQPPPDMARSKRWLAHKAYPDLYETSLRFRSVMNWLRMFMVFSLVLTCGFTWYLAYGNVEIGRLAAAQKTLAEVQAQVTAQATARATGPAVAVPVAVATPVTTPPAMAESGAVPATGTTLAALGVPYCGQPALPGPGSAALPRLSAVHPTPAQADLCTARADAQDQVATARKNLAEWFSLTDDIGDVGRQAERSSALISTLANSILPICYGLLGAAAAVLRLLSKRVRMSLLTPRDMTLSLQQLALGAVVGACIGLFVAAPGDSPASSDLLGTARLSGSALSFVAGFGVDAVFAALEALIARLFATAPTPASTR